MQYFSYRFDRYLEHSDSLPARLLNAYQRGKQLSPPVSDDVDLHYPLPNLLSRQYDQRGNFSAYKLIEALLDGTSLNQHSKEPVVVSPDGEIQRGFSTIASKITQWSDDIPRDANEKKFHVKIQDNLKKEGGTKRDSQYRNESLRDRKETLLKQTGAAFYAILWPGIHSHFDAVEEMIRNELTVIDSNDYDLGDGFAEFVRDVYSKDERNQKWFRENKIHELERNPPVIRVLTLEILNPSFRMDNGQLMAEQTSELKMEIRRRASELTDKYVYGTELHMTDNFINNAHTGYLIANIDKYT